uniref:Putative flavoprotein n=1 Tax=uncultured bacterium UPO47 TaxID=1776972 RepID=A0A126SY85_9BACT|nr:putative flavoprotein [uncultured bacterium UPO47]
MANDPRHPVDAGRRGFILTAGGGLLAAGALAGLPSNTLATGGDWDRVTDVLVVGSGAAGFSAALFAREAGAQVLLLEKGPVPGGTTLRSGGVHYIPNNRFLRAAGVADPREDFLRLAVRMSYPDRYRPEVERFGAGAAEYALLEAFYDQAAPTVDRLTELGIVDYLPFIDYDARPFPDNYAELPENRAPRGRGMVCKPGARREGRFYYKNGGGVGVDLIELLQAAAQARDIAILTRHAVGELVRDAAGDVLGVVAEHRGQRLRVGARRGVVFASGGYIHDADLRVRHLLGPVYGGCGAPTNRGDFLRLAAGAGAALGNLQHGWWMELLLEEALASSDAPTGVWVVPGDSSLAVNLAGERYANEKNHPGSRPRAHFVWDPVRGDYPQRVTLMIWDGRTVQHRGGVMGVQKPGAPLPGHVIAGEDWPALARAIAARLEKLRPKIGDVSLAPDFVKRLEATVARYDDFARRGVDEDFGRGAAAADVAWNYFGNLPVIPSDYPNPTMHPLAPQGPYFAAFLVAGAIDSKGGPQIDANARVLSAGGAPVGGLYGAGNCIASPTGGAYWGGGSTIGPAVVFGQIAGNAAARAPLRSL